MKINIGPIEIDIVWIIAFFSGAFTCFLILLLWYFVSVVKSLRPSFKLRKADEEDIDETEIEWLIKDALSKFKNNELRDKEGYGNHLLKVATELSNDIATKFYPRSKYPYLELTLDESLELLRYISDRFKGILNKPLLKMFKGVTLRQLVQLNDTKEKFDNNLIVKTSNKYKLDKLFKNTMMVVNAINPVYWFRRLVIDRVTKSILVKLGLMVIQLTGEETYRIYSKKMFREEKELDSGIDEIYKSMEKTIKEEGKDEEQKE